MKRMFLPAGIALIAILGLSFYEGFAMKDRWGEPGAEAADLGIRFEKVPKEIGDWVGEDLPVDEITRKTAGAVKYVSRLYTHALNGKQVRLWLIIGHSRDIVRHTPNICYPSSGFRQAGAQLQYDVIYGDNKKADFYTSKFEKEDAFSRTTERVFWTFNHPDTNQWEAPEGSQGARWRYGLARALYKLYFASKVTHEEDTIDANVAAEFAELMLPEIDKALFPTASTESEAALPSTATTDLVDPLPVGADPAS